MLETLICAMFTILPDFLFRRYVQGKRIGHEINFFSVWYELRWGLVTCFMATTTVITLLFYFHPSTSAVSSYFRTVTILPEAGGRVAEIYVVNNQAVKAGDPLFRLDSASQEAAAATAETQVDQVTAALEVAPTEIAAAQASLDQAKAAYELVEADYLRNKKLLDEGSPAANRAEVDRQASRLKEREGQVHAAEANLEAVKQNMEILLPAQKASAVAALEQAQTQLEKTLVVAGISGRIEQFALEVGDVVNPLLRPAGLLVPTESGHIRFQAGFNQLAAQVLKPGMIAEIGCLTKPFTVVPMVIVAVQDVIPSGQFRPSDRLYDPQDNERPGTITTFMEPLYQGGIDPLPPGSTCIANAYTSNHERMEHEEMSTAKRIGLHIIDGIGVVHAAMLRFQMLLLPVTTLVFSGH
ncbi:HlyD family secretion protein [Sedimentitalea todarodis]|uniref:Biotin/lipoyl-binding protein n=1 Tax=Sedimentitalea todarodis TaxID=1631240 RepID=A0ABU3V9H6_9RHOB|nr:biotin/lipoyl-binding protein [Sedimentitalea todarodis]MDU9002831.1 biotin/lipoyl-binding protein [Sedimentitalea todarodis]